LADKTDFLTLVIWFRVERKL